MKVVILCGGKGTRMGETTSQIPKPLVRLQGKPLLWHIMHIYSSYGFNEFIFALGYKGEKIKEYFVNHDWLNHDCVRDSRSGIRLLQKVEPWEITFVDTGLETMTGGRLQRVKHLIKDDTFMLTYGDGLADLDMRQLLHFHHTHNRICTVTGVYHKSSFGILEVENFLAVSFTEKASTNDLINGGFFVLNRQIFDYLSGDDACVFEKQPLQDLARDRELAVYLHKGFWMAVDTQKDLQTAEQEWKGSAAKQERSLP